LLLVLVLAVRSVVMGLVLQECRRRQAAAAVSYLWWWWWWAVAVVLVVVEEEEEGLPGREMFGDSVGDSAGDNRPGEKLRRGACGGG
jgi:hypothetical protein